MSTTAGKLIDDTLGLLQSWSSDEEQATTLDGPLDADDLTFTVTVARGIATGISPGIVEIGQELLFVESVSGTTAKIAAWGRGYKSTTASAHPTGSRVVSQPSFPRSKILDELNQTLDRVFPEVFAVRSYETSTTFPVVTYDLPDDASWVLGAKWMVPDGRQYWQTVRRWRMSPGGGTQYGDSGVTVDVGDSMIPGRPIQFLYAATPGKLTAETDIFTTATGLGTGMLDVIQTGAAAKLTRAQELARLQTSSVEQQNRSQLVAPSAALQSSNFLEKEYASRLAEERTALQRLYPPRITGPWL